MSTAAAQAHGPLMRTLIRSGEQAGVTVAFVSDYCKRWASPTFEGGRHVLQLRGKSSDAMLSWLTGLDEDTVQLRGFTIAGLDVSCIECCSGTTTAHLEAITLKDG